MSFSRQNFRISAEVLKPSEELGLPVVPLAAMLMGVGQQVDPFSRHPKFCLKHVDATFFAEILASPRKPISYSKDHSIKRQCGNALV